MERRGFEEGLRRVCQMLPGLSEDGAGPVREEEAEGSLLALSPRVVASVW